MAMMKFRETIEQFLMTKTNNSESNRTVETYKRKITIFAEYLMVKRNITDDNYTLILRSLEPSQIIESIVYYVDKCNIRYKSTVDTYFTVIKEYFKYLQSNYNIRNDNIDQNHKALLLKEQVDTKIKELKLNLTQQCDPLSKFECRRLIDICNEKINSVSDIQIVKDGYNSDYSLFVSSIIIKVLLYTGIKISTLTSIKLSDYDRNLNKLKINSYWIHLPDDLAAQLKRYVNLRQSLLSNNSNCMELFVNRNNSKSTMSNSKMFEVLNLVVGHKKSIAISKYAIIEMIKVNIPSYVIMEFTGYKSDVYDHCLEIASQELDAFKDRDLDAKMRSLDLFDKL